jgi:electron transport complex protein RnfD
MAKKIRLLPSSRSRFINDEHMTWILRSLLIIAFAMVITNWYLFSFMHGIKLVIMVVISIVVTREVENIFYQHNKDITREESKELIKNSYPDITAMIYVLLIPLGTPLWLVAIGAILATVLGKLIFGGFHHMVFHSSLVGVMFVTLGWSQIENTASFTTSFDNSVLKFIFDNKFFNETLRLGNIFNPDDYRSSLQLLQTGEHYPLMDLVYGLTPGVIVSGLLVIILGILLRYKKCINLTIPFTFIGSFLVTAYILTFVKELDMLYPIHQLFSGSLLFVVFFAATNPITSPIPMKGKIVFGIVAGSLTMLIRNGSENIEGVLFAVLFMQMLTPMLNEWFKVKKTKKKVPPKKEVTI